MSTDTTAQDLATLRKWDNEPDLQRALDSIEARIATLERLADKYRVEAHTLTEERDEAERQRDYLLRRNTVLNARVTQLEAALRVWASGGEPGILERSKALLSAEGEPAEDRCPNACLVADDGTRYLVSTHAGRVLCSWSGHTTPKEDRR